MIKGRCKNHYVQVLFCGILLFLSTITAMAQETPPPKPYGGLPPQFLGYWRPADPHYCIGVNIHPDGRMNYVCERDRKLLRHTNYRFDCSPDPKTAYIIVEDKEYEDILYYKLVIDDQYIKKYGNKFLMIYDLGTAARNRSDIGPVQGCDKKRGFFSGPETYMRNVPH